MTNVSDKRQESEVIRAQIGVSIGLARSVVAKWLPPPTQEDKQREEKDTTAAVLVNRRAPRAGLGAVGEKDPNAELSLGEMKIQRKMQQKAKRIEQGKREREQERQKRRQDSSDEDELRKGEKRRKVAFDVHKRRKT